jgi:DNA-binding MarR family transcriptional regulator
MMTSRNPVDLDVEEERLLANRIGTAWKEMRRGAAMSALRDHLFGAGDEALEPGQYDTLELLVQQEAWRMSDLADALRVDPSTATRAVQRLLREGLAERHHSTADGRVVMVSATAVGRRRYEAIARQRRAVMAEMLAAFDHDERQRLADLLERFVVALDGYAARMSPDSHRTPPPAGVTRAPGG